MTSFTLITSLQTHCQTPSHSGALELRAPAQGSAGHSAAPVCLGSIPGQQWRPSPTRTVNFLFTWFPFQGTTVGPLGWNGRGGTRELQNTAHAMERLVLKMNLKTLKLGADS